MKSGDRVWAFDLRAREWQLSVVKKTFVQDYDHVAVGITVDGETIVSTYRHPYWVLSGDELDSRPSLPHHLEGQLPEEGTLPGRWVDAGDMRVGDVVLLRDGRQVPVSHVDMEPSRMKVYNFNVEALHCYAVGERQVLVHNTNGDEPSEPPKRAREKADNLKGRDALRKHNEAVQSLVKKYNLTKAQQRQLHDEISKQFFERDEIEDIIKGLFDK